MSLYHNMYSPGYAIPDYILAEPPGRGTFTTEWLPRGTISQVIPDYMAVPKATAGVTDVVYSQPVRLVSMAAMAYHGYKRNRSVGWAIAWALLGSAFPLIAPAVAVAQGYGKRKVRSNPIRKRRARRNRRRRSRSR